MVANRGRISIKAPNGKLSDVATVFKIALH